MKHPRHVQQATALVIALSWIALSSIGGADSVVEKRQSIADQELFFAPVPKAVCGPGDRPETGLQGQVPAPERAQPGGFQGFSCNLQLIAQVKGEGASWSATEMREGSSFIGRIRGRTACAYHGTASPAASSTRPGRTNYGTRVIDVSDPFKPVLTTYLTTPAMTYPHESLKVNEKRRLLGGVRADDFAPLTGGTGDFDVYDVGGDCRYPQLLATVTLTPPDSDPVHTIRGHEGNWAPDGLTYYASDLSSRLPGQLSLGQYYAVDTTDTTKPKIIATWSNPIANTSHHGLSISDDGTRGYFTVLGNSLSRGAPPDLIINPDVPATNGMLIYDVSEIQARRSNPQVKLISSISWKDGQTAQHTINIKIKGKPYAVFVDEAGSPNARALGCPEGFAIYPMARIIDISDETKPKVVSKLMLEADDPKTCSLTATDGPGMYGSHYCSVDNRHRATTLACGYMSAGIRVFDIRDPIRPREIAYYNPPGVAVQSPGSAGFIQAGGPDSCTSQVLLDAQLGTLWTTCWQNGLLSLKFTHNAWPFAESRTPPGMQN